MDATLYYRPKRSFGKGNIYRPKRSFGQGNIFTPVCHSVHRGECSRYCFNFGGGAPDFALIFRGVFFGGGILGGSSKFSGGYFGGVGPPNFGGVLHWNMANVRPVHILLECILVSQVSVIYSVHRGGALDIALILGGCSRFCSNFWGGIFLGGYFFKGGYFLEGVLGGIFSGRGYFFCWGGIFLGGYFFGGGYFLGGDIFGGGIFLWGVFFGGGIFWGGIFSGGYFGGVFLGGSPPEYGQHSAGTHPTGMHSCSSKISGADP